MELLVSRNATKNENCIQIFKAKNIMGVAAEKVPKLCPACAIKKSDSVIHSLTFSGVEIAP